MQPRPTPDAGRVECDDGWPQADCAVQVGWEERSLVGDGPDVGGDRRVVHRASRCATRQLALLIVAMARRGKYSAVRLLAPLETPGGMD